MAKTGLVNEDIEAGREIHERLRAAPDVRMEAAFWWLKDDEEWRYVVATPVVHEFGRIPAHRKIEAALGADRERPDIKSVLRRLDVLSPSEGLMTWLDLGADRRPPTGRLVDREGIGGVYIEGAYFYQFAPQTYLTT